jgi:hemoglobin
MVETHYQRLAGEETIRRLVDRFYDLMDSEPEYYGIRKLHPPSLDGARGKLFMFLSGWTGGPQPYTEQFGHPRLRQRHLPFPIGGTERDQWMACMVRAMEDVGVEEKLRAELTAAFAKTADFMRNKEE